MLKYSVVVLRKYMPFVKNMKKGLTFFQGTDPTQTREKMAEKLGRTVRTIQRALDKLISEKKIKRVGSKKTGYLEVLQ